MSGNFWLFIMIIFPIICAFFSYFIGKKNKKYMDFIMILSVVIEFVLIIFLCINVFLNESSDFYFYVFGGMGIHLRMDNFRALYSLITAFMWLMTGLFSREYFMNDEKRDRYYFFNLLTLGATIGVFLSVDLYTTFLFFEAVSFTSYVWIAQNEKKESLRAASTYLTVAVFGGLLLLMGLFLLYESVGTLEIDRLASLCKEYSDKRKIYGAGICIFFGFGAKAGVFPLHIWLPQAHPAAPAPASALLSGILTKTGIFGILAITHSIFLYDPLWGMGVLAVGNITAVLGAVLAVCSIDLKRTLACSSMSQIGFILIGIGLQGILGRENALAVQGTIFHMVNHSLIKLVLFLAAGVIYHNIHKLDLNEIRGFGKGKPLLHGIFLMGILGMGGMPFWNGYISKTLLHESLIEAMSLTRAATTFIKWSEQLFVVCGGLTAAYCLKLYVCIFLEKNENEKVQTTFLKVHEDYMGKLSQGVLTISGVLLPVIGILPFFAKVIPLLKDIYPSIAFLSFENLKGAFLSISIGILVYFLLIRLLFMRKNAEGVKRYVNGWPASLSLEYKLFRPVLFGLLPLIGGTVSRFCDRFMDSMIVFLRKTVYRDKKVDNELLEGSYFTYKIGSMMDCIVNWRQKGEKSTGRMSYVHRLAVIRDELMENNQIIRRSLSFGLFMVCLGLTLTLVYLLF